MKLVDFADAYDSLLQMLHKTFEILRKMPKKTWNWLSYGVFEFYSKKRTVPLT